MRAGNAQYEQIALTLRGVKDGGRRGSVGSRRNHRGSQRHPAFAHLHGGRRRRGPHRRRRAVDRERKQHARLERVDDNRRAATRLRSNRSFPSGSSHENPHLAAICDGDVDESEVRNQRSDLENLPRRGAMSKSSARRGVRPGTAASNAAIYAVRQSLRTRRPCATSRIRPA